MKMKKIRMVGLIISLAIMCVSCATTGGAQSVKEFKEIDAKDFSYSTAVKNLWHGVILNNAAIYTSDKEIYIRSNYGDKITIWTLDLSLYNDKMTDEEISEVLKNSLPKWIQDNYDLFNDKIITGQPLYSVKLVLNRYFNPLSLEITYDKTAELISIEGIEEAYEKNLIAEKEKAEQQALKEQEEAEKQAAKEAKAKEIAKGYIYHGFDEIEKNKKKMKNKTLEEGHAYYISDWVFSKNQTNIGKVIISLFEESGVIYVDYINNDVKDEVLEAGNTIFGNLPIEIVVTGTRSGNPIILGVLN